MNPEALRLSAIVLDFDGVILESVDIKTEVFRELFAPHKDQLSRILEYHTTHNGISRIIKLKHIFEEFLNIPYTLELERQTTERFSQLAFDRVLHCPFVAGAEAFLEQFSKTYPLYVASASPHEELLRVIRARNLERFFAGVYGHPTNKRQVLERVCLAHQATPDHILYIGDSQEDLQVARDTGVRFAGRRNKEVLPENGISVFNDLSEIRQWIESGAMKNSLV